MTTIFNSSITCKICDTLSTHKQIGSTNAFGPSDLDLRPPEMQRSTMNLWIEVCPECGYSAVDISRGNRDLKSIIESEVYQKQLTNPSYPILANKFLCQSMLVASEDDYETAAWASLHAAWACDDGKINKCAMECREKAVSLFSLAKEKKNSLLDEPRGGYYALMTDLLRRAKRFTTANEYCVQGMDNNPAEIIERILSFELELIHHRDSKRHHIGELRNV